MVITEHLLLEGMSSRGAWSEAQVRLLGESGTNNNRGWRRRVIGREIPDADAERFVLLKDAHLKKKKRKGIMHSMKGNIRVWLEDNQYKACDCSGEDETVVIVKDLMEFLGI